MFDQIKEAADYIVTHLNVKPKIGMVLGTGLSNIASEIEDEVIIRYAAIPWFSHSTVASHKGEMVFGRLGEKDVVILAGRFHYYEGYTMQQVTFPVRVLKELGVETILISNAAGSVNAAYEAGDIVFLKDHINLMPENPLRGPNDERLGLRFPDMSDAYDKNLIEKAVEIANKNNIRCHQGVYVALQGPNLETPSEYNFINVIGGDLVGMSTVPEVLVARHCGMRVFGVSVVSNKCFPLSAIKETTHESVIAVANETEPKLAKIFKEIIQFID
ncbi:MAG TPA: purine-nucleoside phosphorylase [Saprospiraceae bacterium]|nr:purine-nucleoside phosphorylase [Saprospiraceae bacterium]HMW74200.1 purine-nucleoside phosphorylase [Saprospiraceae bacterium]HMX81748.1 purine-nucleoside phosphorylase [Saprospiraceae bacterium]HNA42127.1 purine-nucleoside phosphorylase [Saprospiraceae bacterium]HNE64459.1 purine-nucleoside phosphorylase [Saprospiraceae bacterium]